MKSIIVCFLLIVLELTQSQAQNTSSTPNTNRDYPTTHGIRVALLANSLESHLSSKDIAVEGDGKEKLDASPGFSLGYASLPVQQLGWTANLAYLDLSSDKSYVGLLRADGNLAYSLNEVFNVKGGLNVSKYTGKIIQQLDPAIGFQAGLGIQLTQNFGIDIAYTQMHQSGTIQGYQLDVTVSGAEIGLYGSF